METTNQDQQQQPADPYLPASNGQEEEESKDEVTPFLIQATKDTGIDYDKLVDRFGCSRMNDELREKIERLTG